jgi:hypothetical protein
VFARVEGAGSPHDSGVSLRVMAGGDVGFAWEASARANHTFYLGPAVGLHYVQFESRDTAPTNALLFSVALRTGFRFLRFYGFDVDLYAQLHLPLYKTSDPDSGFDAWTPYMMTGLGVGF